jgi:hypothetical protein
MLCLIETAIGYAVLLIVGTNLAGFVIPPRIIEAPPDTAPFAVEEYKKSGRASRVTWEGGTLVTALYLYLLWHFCNGGVVLAATMVMVPHWLGIQGITPPGQRMTSTLTYLVLSLGPLPVLWFALCWAGRMTR